MQVAELDVVITNFNMAAFVRGAVDSALGQRGCAVRVIVVDDGSTDESRELLRRYGERITVVEQPNRGQSSAVAAGVAGGWAPLVCLLDADDLFLPGKGAAVRDAWASNPRASVIYHRMRGIDADGAPLWGGRAWPTTLCRGRIGGALEHCGGWWPWPTTSALAFPRAFLERVLPVPEADIGTCTPDAYLAGLAPYFGEVMGLPDVLTLYRVHGASSMSRLFEGPHGEARKAERYAGELRTVSAVLRDRFGIPTRMALDDHFRYLNHRRRAGQGVSRLRVAAALARCPLLPPPEKARELNRLLVRGG